MTSFAASNAGVTQPGTVTVTTSGSSLSSPQVGITRIVRISSAHFLPFHLGKCKDVHGHNYKIEVTMGGEIQSEGGLSRPNPETGMVADFGHLDGEIEEFIIKPYDHKLLNHFFDNPTAENLAVAWLRRLKEQDPRYVRVTVWETDDCYATVTWY